MPKFKDKLKKALDEFDMFRAESVLEEINEAESSGYQLSFQETRLLDRLLQCLASFKKTSSLID
jgi:hypothetical protein